MNTLLIEILACLFAAAVLSLFVGWAIRGAAAQKAVNAANAAWEVKLSELKLQHKQDTEHLEDQVDRLGSQSNQLAHRNDSINESLRQNELSVHQARADAIELNRQQADTQERLQRIIAQKDEELKLFREKAAKAKAAQTTTASNKVAAAGKATTTAAAAVGVAAVAVSSESTKAKIASLSAKRKAWEAERQRLIKSMGDDQETIVIDPADLPVEPLDKTVRIDQEQSLHLKSRLTKQRESHDIETDKTMTIEDDQTMVLDEHNMNIKKPQDTGKKKPNPNNSDN